MRFAKAKQFNKQFKNLKTFQNKKLFYQQLYKFIQKSEELVAI